MQSSPSASEDTSDTKAALDHLQRLIGHLLRENGRLKDSLHQTRAQLDEVRAHLNRFKLQVTEQEENDRLVRKQIRNMTALIERHRDGNLPPSSPEACPTPPPSSVNRLPPSPNTPLCTRLPTDVANVSDAAPVSQTSPTSFAPALPDVNGNRSETPSANDSDAVPCADSRITRNENIQQAESSRTVNSPRAVSRSRSLPLEDSADKVSSPSTSLSDALQKAFVAMEKDTTNAVQVLHDTKHVIPPQSATGGEDGTERVLQPCSVKDTAQVPDSCDANRRQGDGSQHNLKTRAGSSRRRSLKTLKRRAAGTSPASDTAVSASTKRSSAKSVNGRLKRPLTQRQSSRSPSRTANRLAKNVALRKSKKGYKVSLGLSRNSSRSGRSSSSSSDDDSDSSGPGCSAKFSGPLSRPGKAQVSMEGGLPDLLSAARKLKGSFGQQKKDQKNPDDDTESGKKLSESHSNNADLENTTSAGIGNGPVAAGAAIGYSAAALSAAAINAASRSEDGNGSLSYATGSPKLGESVRGAVMMNQGQTNDTSVWQHLGQSNPFTYGSTSNFESMQYTSGTPHNPVPESAKARTSFGLDHFGSQRTNGIHPTVVKNHPQVTMTSQNTIQDSKHQSLTLGRGTENDITESSVDSENATIHEITHVPVRPKSFATENNRNSTTSSSALRRSPGDTTEFLTIHPHSSEKLRWKTRPGSKYIDAANDALAVKHPAAVSLEDGKVVMNGKMRVLRPVGPTSNNANYCYVSPKYPDGTFLPYVPVSGVVLHSKPVHWDSSQYADRNVQLSFSKEVFDALVSYTRRAYRKRYPGAQVNFPKAFLCGHRVRKVVRIEPECSVNMTRLHKTPSKCSVSETLAAVKKDVIGLALLYLSIEERTEDCLSVEVMFGLHSMVAFGLSTERRR